MFLSEIQILVIYNPKAGKGKTRRLMPELKRMYVKAGLCPYFYATKRQNDAYEKAKRFSEKYYICNEKSSERKHSVYVIAAGGDGTLNEVMRGVLESNCDVPIGIIPAGSTNDFGYSLGINNGMLDAAEKAMNAILMDEVFECDAALMKADNSDKYITYTAAFGLFSDVSYATPQKLKNKFGHLAYIMYGAANIFKNRPIEVSIELYNNERKEQDAGDKDKEGFHKTIKEKLLLGMFVSAKSVGGFREITGRDVNMDDGEHELLFVRWPKNPVNLLKTLIHAAGMIRKSADAQEKAVDLSIDYGIKILKIQKAKFVFDKPVPWALDGEDGGKMDEVTIEVKKQAVNYLIV